MLQKEQVDTDQLTCYDNLKRLQQQAQLGEVVRDISDISTVPVTQQTFSMLPSSIEAKRQDKRSQKGRDKKKYYKPSPKSVWTNEEDQLLLKYASLQGAKSKEQVWANIGTVVKKSMLKCYNRYIELTTSGSKQVNGRWTKEEEDIIIEHIQYYGARKWTKCASKLPGRLGKQCSQHWVDALDPNVNRLPWTPEEDKIIIQHVIKGELCGSKIPWSRVARQLDGRTANQVNNRYSKHLKRHYWSLIRKDVEFLRKSQIDP